MCVRYIVLVSCASRCVVGNAKNMLVVHVPRIDTADPGVQQRGQECRGGRVFTQDIPLEK